MMVERNTNQQSFNCWLSVEEYEQLRRSTESYRDELVIRFGGEVGLRSFEVPQITPEHVRHEVVEGEDYYFLRVPQGKDTTGSGGKPRDAYLPREVERDLHRYQRAENIAQSDPVIDVTPRTVQRVVKTAATRAAGRIGNDDFRKVSSHDPGGISLIRALFASE